MFNHSKLFFSMALTIVGVFPINDGNRWHVVSADTVMCFFEYGNRKFSWESSEFRKKCLKNTGKFLKNTGTAVYGLQACKLKLSSFEWAFLSI